jgi:hypothetical protein
VPLSCAPDQATLDLYLDGDADVQAQLVEAGLIKFTTRRYAQGNSKHPGPGTLKWGDGSSQLSATIPVGTFVVEGMCVRAFAFRCCECRAGGRCEPNKLRRFRLCATAHKVVEY